MTNWKGWPSVAEWSCLWYRSKLWPTNFWIFSPNSFEFRQREHAFYNPIPKRPKIVDTEKCKILLENVKLIYLLTNWEICCDCLKYARCIFPELEASQKQFQPVWRSTRLVVEWADPDFAEPEKWRPDDPETGNSTIEDFEGKRLSFVPVKL